MHNPDTPPAAPTGTAPAAAVPSIVAAGHWPRTALAIQGLVVLFMLFDGAARIARFAPYVEGTTRYGYPESFGPWLGLTLIACTVLYAVPATAVLGGVLLTAYLGGAVASHLRVGEPFVFPVLMGLLVWAALYLRDPELRALLPWRAPRGD